MKGPPCAAHAVRGPDVPPSSRKLRSARPASPATDALNASGNAEDRDATSPPSILTPPVGAIASSVCVADRPADWGRGSPAGPILRALVRAVAERPPVTDTADPALATLDSTPDVLDALLRGVPDAVVRAPGGPGAWSAFDVVGHLAWGEEDDWIPRVRRILDHGASRAFDPFDREGMRTRWQGAATADVLAAFRRLRAANLATLRALRLGPADLERAGMHPALGAVTLGQLLAAWVVHDLDHVAQLARILAHPRAGDVGPWRAYLPILPQLAPGEGPHGESSGGPSACRPAPPRTDAPGPRVRTSEA